METVFVLPFKTWSKVFNRLFKKFKFFTRKVGFLLLNSIVLFYAIVHLREEIVESGKSREMFFVSATREILLYFFMSLIRLE
jgi:hypothetical protein